MQYEQYTEVDFLKDEYFLKWVMNADEATEHFWQNWLSSHPEKTIAVQKARYMLKSLEYEEKHKLPAKEYTSVLENIIKYERNTIARRQRSSETRVKKIWWAVAASLLLIASIMSVLKLEVSGDQEKAGSLTYIVKEVPPGVKTTIQLPDGTTVKLNSGSSLKYPETFGSEDRKVVLKGEAFFDVVKDNYRPFIISTGKISTQVLGTQFNVKAYENDHQIKVAVVTGLVRVNNSDGNTVVVEPSSMAVFDRAQNDLVKQEYNAKSEIGWKDDILFFKNTPFSQVFDQLENWYGVTIKIEGGMTFRGNYTGEYQQETLQNVLDGISYTYKFKYKIVDKEVIIYKP